MIFSAVQPPSRVAVGIGVSVGILVGILVGIYVDVTVGVRVGDGVIVQFTISVVT